MRKYWKWIYIFLHILSERSRRFISLTFQYIKQSRLKIKAALLPCFCLLFLICTNEGFDLIEVKGGNQHSTTEHISI